MYPISKLVCVTHHCVSFTRPLNRAIRLRTVFGFVMRFLPHAKWPNLGNLTCLPTHFQVGWFFPDYPQKSDTDDSDCHGCGDRGWKHRCRDRNPVKATDVDCTCSCSNERVRDVHSGGQLSMKGTVNINHGPGRA